MEEKAARAYDLAALKYWGPSTHINFPVTILSYSHAVICWFFVTQMQLFCVLVVGKLSTRT